MTIGKHITEKSNMAEIDLTRLSIGRRENGERGHCGVVGTVFHVRRLTMTNGLRDMKILYPIGKLMKIENGIINLYIFEVTTEMNVLKKLN